MVEADAGALEETTIARAPWAMEFVLNEIEVHIKTGRDEAIRAGLKARSQRKCWQWSHSPREPEPQQRQALAHVPHVVPPRW